MALIGSACAQTVELFSDSNCKTKIQTIKFTSANVFQCGEVTNPNGAKSAIISKTGYTNRGFNVWDSDYCAGDMAGGYVFSFRCPSGVCFRSNVADIVPSQSPQPTRQVPCVKQLRSYILEERPHRPTKHQRPNRCSEPRCRPNRI